MILPTYYEEGRRAWRTANGPCPYDPESDRPSEVARYQSWMAGWWDEEADHK
ncbi:MULTISPECIES: hypothetical protein [unclassified Caulobacter]|uniref:hypothetical protein n=1 Tax=unclassified Caulobacter TaxID=2648921 RepID=UPI0013049E7A|nr:MULTISPECIES: hypothetical protein [unclassified Caulobacter]